MKTHVKHKLLNHSVNHNGDEKIEKYKSKILDSVTVISHPIGCLSCSRCKQIRRIVAHYDKNGSQLLSALSV